jgi:hypothetical protein
LAMSPWFHHRARLRDWLRDDRQGILRHRFSMRLTGTSLANVPPTLDGLRAQITFRRSARAGPHREYRIVCIHIWNGGTTLRGAESLE